jgi:DNA-binding NarL/FixJ family response regulator
MAPTGTKIRVLLADDHATTRRGLAALLAEEPDFEVVGHATDGHEAVELARELQPDVVVMDVNMPHLDGLGATRIITTELTVAVIGLSLHEEEYISTAMRSAGARACLAKSGPPEDLIAAIRKVRDE